MPCGPMKQNVLTPIIFRQNIDQTTTEAKKKKEKNSSKNACKRKNAQQSALTFFGIVVFSILGAKHYKGWGRAKFIPISFFQKRLPKTFINMTHNSRK